jgi:hypothetical protein
MPYMPTLSNFPHPHTVLELLDRRTASDEHKVIAVTMQPRTQYNGRAFDICWEGRVVAINTRPTHHDFGTATLWNWTARSGGEDVRQWLTVARHDGRYGRKAPTATGRKWFNETGFESYRHWLAPTRPMGTTRNHWFPCPVHIIAQTWEANANIPGMNDE